MRKKINSCFIIIAFLLSLSSMAGDLTSVDKILKEADSLWLQGKMDQVLGKYDEALKNLPREGELFRPSIILRYARALHSAGKKEEALKQLDSLESFEYLPEHIALFAKELRSEIVDGSSSATDRTPVPPLKKADQSFFVSPVVAPRGNGTIKSPFRNIHTALAEVLKYASAAKDRKTVEIVLLPGIHYMKQTAVLKVPAQVNLVIRSADSSNRAVICGGTELKKWSEVKDPAYLSRIRPELRDKLIECKLDDNGVPDIGELTFGGFSSVRAETPPPSDACEKEFFNPSYRFATMPVPELFYDGKVQTMGRWPNEGFATIPVNKASNFDKKRLQFWKIEDSMWLYGYWSKTWADAYEKLESIEPNGSIKVVAPENRYGFGIRKGCAVNALCEVDTPGEWYLDSKKHTIIYYPPENFIPEKTIISSTNTAFIAEGISGAQLRDIDIEYFRGDACKFIKCDKILMDHVNIRRCSGTGIKILGGKNHLIYSVSISEMGRGGIDIISGDWKNLVPGNSVIENCYISKLSRIDRTYTPALLLEGMGLKVRNNVFEDIPSSAIRIEGCSALVELNVFRHCVHESGDQGAIDMWANPLYRGNIIRWNCFDSIINNKSHQGAAAVRCDDFISGFMIAQNIMYRGGEGAFGAVQFNQGTDNIVEGNTIIEWQRIASGRSACGKNWTNKILQHRNAGPLLKEVDWKSEKWQTAYPMLKNLLDGRDNHNWLIGNLALSSTGKSIIAMAKQICIDNIVKKEDIKINKLPDLKKYMRPWYPTPVDKIGTRD